MAKEKITNDQGELIQLLRNKKYEAAWQKVIQIGIDIYPDMRKRKNIFYEAAASFDPYKNNNFIWWYLNGLQKYKNNHSGETFRDLNTPSLKKLKIREQISPSDDIKSETVRDSVYNWA